MAHAILFGCEGLVHETLPFDGAEVLDQVLVLAAPVDESAFCHAELFGNAGEADAPGAEFNELLNGLLIFHCCLSSGPLFGRGPGCAHGPGAHGQLLS
jgi:hypothetical protein